ncbi:MAG: FHA domain-containing protein [Blastochloris sp.]|nr:FHA domain-containing protein [Blastochloris sp.]
MSQISLPDYLQTHGQSQDTGCLLVEGSRGLAIIYLLNGDIVFSQFNDHQGLAGIFLALTWKNASVKWQPRVPAPKKLFRLSVEEVLFQFAQLRDGGHASEEDILASYVSDPSETAKSVKQVDLSQYDISFEVLNGAFKGFIFHLLQPEILIGRQEDCDVLLPDGSISSHHCKIFKEEFSLRILDLDSTNGTFINGKSIAEAILNLDDKLQIGSLSLAVRLKMQRKLAMTPIVQEVAPPKDQRPIFNTTKLDPIVMSRRTSKVTGPITWQNAGGKDPKKTTSSGNIFSKMFGKK